ncbi:hypothetical protein BV898_06412 [Hypsibius exemplaris]|uniref:Uncharacterized protein n=1 Tax=Hypsibius exemplaris TaxID=2072580 RepID=A0A1W0WWR5_HYPEX|nr:hypothetical protein BV898_06412 [Hypsibius exemplaris]
MSPAVVAWPHCAWISGWCCWALLLLAVVAAADSAVDLETTTFSSTTEYAVSEEDQLPSYLPDQEVYNEDLDDLNVYAPVKIARSLRAKYDPTYRWLGIGKRDVIDIPRPKFGQSYKWIGLGKRPDSKPKFNQGYKWIGLGKRSSSSSDSTFIGRPKYNQGYKWIGLGKRFAPFAVSGNMLAQMASFRELFDKSTSSRESNKHRISRTSPTSTGTGSSSAAAEVAGSSPGRHPVFSVVTKKYQTDSLQSPIEQQPATLKPDIVISTSSEETDSLEPPAPAAPIGRPNVRGGSPSNYEPIYRFIGLG